METDHVPPDKFDLDCDAGIFLMSSIGDGVFEGCANGFGLNICTERKTGGMHYQAHLFREDDRFPFKDVSVSGDAQHIDDLVAALVSWIDSSCRETVENYAEEVLHIPTPNGRLAYWTYNTHLDSTPVIFIHGGPGGDSNPVKARRLHLHNPVYLYDQMGCGLSDPIADLASWTAEDYARELDLFIRTLGFEKVILIGASWGSGLSVAYAGLHGCGSIAAMVLPSPFLSTELWTEDMYLNLEEMEPGLADRTRVLISRRDFGDDFIRILGRYNSRYLFNRKENLPIAVGSASMEPPEVFRVLNGPNDMCCDGTLKDFDVTDVLPEIDVPVLLMCADSDEVRMERLLEYHRAIKGSRVSIVPHAGHVLASEQFDSYRAAIQAFFRENGL
ncbi:MAG: alpha/beta fold hydrolase [archaeon]|nr:alpha/beta fold hydrolase [archaeon]